MDRLIRDASTLPEPGLRIGKISEKFLGVPYHGFTLVGDSETPERLVIDLEGVDCFTFLDYVEAMRISRSAEDFMEALVRVRYREGKVAFDHRNHFFTDWIQSPGNSVHDITREIGRDACVNTVKRLNMKEDGSLFLPGLGITEREVWHIPAGLIDGSMEEMLRTGDYVGIYSLSDGLDVSHVGIFIRQGSLSFLRHASSLTEMRKVIDQEFRSYLSSKPGMVVVRPA